MFEKNKLEPIGYLVRLKQRTGISSPLKTKGVKGDILHILASKAFYDPYNATNPRPPSLKDLETIYYEAL